MFELTQNQTEKLGKWLLEKWPDGLPYGGAIGGHITYSFTPTSIGTVVKIHCIGEELDVTEYETW
jgi:hypothetical protein